MLGADVVVTKALTLAEAELERLLRARGERNLPGTERLLPFADDGENAGPNVVQLHVELHQHACSESLILPEQAEQEVLGPDVRVPETPRFVLPEDDDLSRPLGEALERGGYAALMSMILNVIFPRGAATSTVSPFLRPMIAFPTGDSFESLFAAGSASAEPTMWYSTVLPALTSRRRTFVPMETSPDLISFFVTTRAFASRSSSIAMRASRCACSFLAASYSAFSAMSPNSRATRIRSAMSRRRSTDRYSISSLSFSKPSGVRMTSFTRPPGRPRGNKNGRWLGPPAGADGTSEALGRQRGRATILRWPSSSGNHGGS